MKTYEDFLVILLFMSMIVHGQSFQHVFVNPKLKSKVALHSHVEFSVILSNIQSGSNIGSICRNALAFNASEVIIVGRNNFEGKMRNADRGARGRLKFTNINSLTEVKDYLLTTKNCSNILGVEIHPEALPIPTYPFTGNVAFMFGNEGGGLSQKQREICSGFVYIPQYAPGGMASINVACASAIIFQYFAIFAKYEESKRQGEKFL